ncbi:response regulator transcription factor [Halomonas sp. 328]|uniref:response regulator transcription factor n=1 Tax=Halomonas sp. 328 TaxID=2776704 RepID=UPI0018A70B0B|nr:response regulator transcription factor [Halomonas sp. 328]MBF8221255.1 response regulator transcription factor [Halomonas sp. 328]
MRHVLVVSGRSPLPRWQHAFPDGWTLTAEEAVSRLGQGDHAWVLGDNDGWLPVVETLAKQGVICVVLSWLPCKEEAFQALGAGARGYAHALGSVELLHEVALVTMHHGLWVGPELLSEVVGATFRALGGGLADQASVLAELTSRERDVVLAVAAGHTNKEVARGLEITERTVKAHLGAAFRKLGVRDRMQLILKLSGHLETT